MMRRVPTLAAALLLVGLAPSSAWADGLGGLASLRTLLYAIVGFVAMLFVAGWTLAFLARRARAHGRPDAASPQDAVGADGTGGSGSNEPQRYWLFDRDFPLGLRVLRLSQYGLAFPYACAGVTRCVMPAAYTNDHVAEWVLQWIVFCAGFTALAILSANAYLSAGDPRGWKLGVALGWLCVGNTLLGGVWHGRYDGFDPISSGFGVVLLLAMQFRYRRWFGCETSRPWVRKLTSTAAVLVGGLLAVLVGLMGLSLLLTGPLEDDRKEVAAHLGPVAEAMQDYYEAHGDWPRSLDDLPREVDLTYRWKRVKYDREALQIYLNVHIPLDPPRLGYRLTFGHSGFTPEIGRIARKLRPRGEAPPAP